MAGVNLLINHPELPSCEDCQRWLHNAAWERTTRVGEPVVRPKGVPTPCGSCPKIPKGVHPCPENAVVISPKNALAYRYYLQCLIDNRGVLQQDRITVRNNALIRYADDRSRQQQNAVLPLMLSMMVKKGR